MDKRSEDGQFVGVILGERIVRIPVFPTWHRDVGTSHHDIWRAVRIMDHTPRPL